MEDLKENFVSKTQYEDLKENFVSRTQYGELLREQQELNRKLNAVLDAKKRES